MCGFQQLLNFKVEEFASLPNLYAAYIAFSGLQTNALVPVAGALEVIVALVVGHKLLPVLRETLLFSAIRHAVRAVRR